MNIRDLGESDVPFLESMLFEAFHWNESSPRLPLDAFRQNPEAAKWLRGWGRGGDRGVIAEQAGVRAGAAWFRVWSEDDHSYGFVRADIPELGIAVATPYRGRGAGRALMNALIRVARTDGYAVLRLSVDPSNHARSLYEALGFRRVGESGTSWTYVLELPE